MMSIGATIDLIAADGNPVSYDDVYRLLIQALANEQYTLLSSLATMACVLYSEEYEPDEDNDPHTQILATSEVVKIWDQEARTVWAQKFPEPYEKLPTPVEAGLHCLDLPFTTYCDLDHDVAWATGDKRGLDGVPWITPVVKRLARVSATRCALIRKELQKMHVKETH